MNLNRVLIIILFLSLFTNGFSKPVKEPVSPSVQGVSLKENLKTYPVEINFKDSETINGHIILKSDKFSYNIIINKRKTLKSILISKVRSIEILKWLPEFKRRKSSLFRPVLYKITLKDKSFFYVRYNIGFFNRLFFKNTNGKRKIYSIFYDYWKKKRWLNSKSFKKEYPEKNPLKGTIVKIVFNENKKNMFDFFKMLK